MRRGGRGDGGKRKTTRIHPVEDNIDFLIRIETSFPTSVFI